MRRSSMRLIALSLLATAALSGVVERAVSTELPSFVDTRRLPGLAAQPSESEQIRLVKEAEAKRAAAAAEAQKLADERRRAEDAAAKQQADEQRRAAAEAEAQRAAAAAEAQKLAEQQRNAEAAAAKQKADEQRRTAAEAEAKRAAAAAEKQKLAEQQRVAEEAMAKQKADEQRRAATEAQVKAESHQAVPAAVLALARKKAAEYEPSDPLTAARAAALLTARNKADADYNIRCMAAANPSEQGC